MNLWNRIYKVVVKDLTPNPHIPTWGVPPNPAERNRITPVPRRGLFFKTSS